MKLTNREKNLKAKMYEYTPVRQSTKKYKGDLVIKSDRLENGEEYVYW